MEESAELSAIEGMEELPVEQATLTPITHTFATKEPETSTLKPVGAVLSPNPRRGPPPSSAPGERPDEVAAEESGEEETTTLTPVSRLTPLKIEKRSTVLQPEEEDSEES